MAITAVIIALNCPSFCAAVETVWLRLCSGKDGLGALQRSEEINTLFGKPSPLEIGFMIFFSLQFYETLKLLLAPRASGKIRWGKS